MTSDEAQRRRALEKLGAAWPSGWTRDAREVYAEQVSDYPPELVNEVVVAVIGSAPRYRPTPGEIRMGCAAAQETRRRRDELDTQATRYGAGLPCPACDREGLTWLDVQRQAKQRPGEAGWFSDHRAGLTHCVAHRITWRGTLPDTDPGVLPQDENARRGNEIIQRLERASRIPPAQLAKPADPGLLRRIRDAGRDAA